jgi:hypothetical protein
MAQSGQESSSSEDPKKKTKLGYHRQSIACVFCRRRKIRCITTNPDCEFETDGRHHLLIDLAGKCDTCLKLHKDCQFLKVNDAIALDHVTPIKRNKRAQSLEYGAARHMHRQSWPHGEATKAYESVRFSGPVETLLTRKSPMQPPPQGQPGRMVFTRDVHRPQALAHQPKQDWSQAIPAQMMQTQRPPMPHRHTEPTGTFPDAVQEFSEQPTYLQGYQPYDQESSPLPTPNLLHETYFATQQYFGSGERYTLPGQDVSYDESPMSMSRSISQPQDARQQYYSTATSERSVSVDGQLTAQPEESAYAPQQELSAQALTAFEADLYRQYQGPSSQSSPLPYNASRRTSHDNYGGQQSPFMQEQTFVMQPEAQIQASAEMYGALAAQMAQQEQPYQPDEQQVERLQAYQMAPGRRVRSAYSSTEQPPFIHYNPRGGRSRQNQSH